MGWPAFWRGIVFFIFPAFLGKMAVGVFNKSQPIMTGVAMIGRGEFAFVVLNAALNLKLINESLFASLVWTILFCIMTCPILLTWLVKKELASDTGHHLMKVQIRTKRHK